MNQTTIKHDVLAYKRSIVHIIGATVNSSTKSILCGHFYINDCEQKEITLDSGTGSQYLVEIPEEYLSQKNASQFNVTITLLKELPTSTQ